MVVLAPLSATIDVSTNCVNPLWLLNVPSKSGKDPKPAFITVVISFIKLFTLVLAAPSPLLAPVYCVNVVCLLSVNVRFCKI